MERQMHVRVIDRETTDPADEGTRSEGTGTNVFRRDLTALRIIVRGGPALVHSAGEYETVVTVLAGEGAEDVTVELGDPDA